jgi:hypothetical protein
MPLLSIFDALPSGSIVTTIGDVTDKVQLMGSSIFVIRDYYAEPQTDSITDTSAVPEPSPSSSSVLASAVWHSGDGGDASVLNNVVMTKDMP